MSRRHRGRGYRRQLKSRRLKETASLAVIALQTHNGIHRASRAWAKIFGWPELFLNAIAPLGGGKVAFSSTSTASGSPRG